MGLLDYPTCSEAWLHGAWCLIWVAWEAGWAGYEMLSCRPPRLHAFALQTLAFRVLNNMHITIQGWHMS